MKENTFLILCFVLCAFEGGCNAEQKDKCSVYGTCSQLCVSSEQGYNCSCIDGFKLAEDGWSCKSLDPNMKLIYGTDEGVALISDLHTQNERTELILRLPSEVRSVTCDVRNNVVYSTRDTIFNNAIYRAEMSTKSTLEVFVETGILYVRDVAFDWITGNVYFVDSVKKQVVVCHNKSSICAVVVSDAGDSPTAIVLHPNLKIMFWTNAGPQYIVRSGMDGTSPRSIIPADFLILMGIAIDYGRSRIYWGDRHRNVIESSDLDGNNRKVVTAVNSDHSIFGIDVFGDRLYWSYDKSFGAPKTQYIHSAEKFNGSDSKVHHTISTEHLFALSVVHLANQPIQIPNTCDKANCSHICTMGPALPFKCLCPAGMQLGGDNKTCAELDNAPKVVVTFGGNIKTMRLGTIGKDLWESVPLDHNIKIISAIVYNPLNHTLILGDNLSKKIYEYCLRSKKLGVLVETDLDTVTSLSLDIVGEVLYWADGDKQTIEALSLRTGTRVLLKSSFPNMHDVMFTPKRSLLIVTSDEKGDKLNEMPLNGGSMTSQQCPKAFPGSFPPWSERTYFRLKLVSHSIEANYSCRFLTYPESDYITANNQTIFTLNMGQYIFISFADKITTGFVNLGSIEQNPASLTTNPNLGTRLALIDPDLSGFGDLLSRHDCARQNPERKRCSHLCFPTGEKYGGVCGCPEDMTLSSNGITCMPLANYQSINCSAGHLKCSDNKTCVSKPSDCKAEGKPVSVSTTTIVLSLIVTISLVAILMLFFCYIRIKRLF